MNKFITVSVLAALISTSSNVLADGYNDIPHTIFPVFPNILRPAVFKNVITFQETPGTPAMFIIGIDKLSVQWLRKNNHYLKSRNAIGLVVHARDNSDLLALKELSGIQQLFPVADTTLSEAWKLSAYPVFIDTASGEIKQ